MSRENRDSIEFYDGDNIITAVNSSMVPHLGSKISIRKQTWCVINVTFAVDHADELFERSMRCNVNLELLTASTPRLD